MCKENAKKIVNGALNAGRKALTEPEAKALISTWGIDVPKSLLIKKPFEVPDEAESLTPPLVLKVVSQDILHKSEVGGVITGITNLEDIERALKEMNRNLGDKAPKARIEGFLLEEMAPSGAEVIVGGLRDLQFGPAVMFGAGGIAVELLKDVSFRLAPLSRGEALDMMREVKSYPLLTGFRGSKPLDVDSVADTIVKVSEILLEIEEIKEIEINPLLVSEMSAVATDARVVLA
jgi:acyl-CoA synthetase (NDP forming)